MSDVNTLVERLETILSDFDAEVAQHIDNETERADLWDEVDVPVFYIREAAALIRSLAAERDEETDESLWRFWNSKARELAADNAALLEVFSNFLPIIDAILAEAPAEASQYIIFIDCEGNRHGVNLDTIHRARAAGRREG